MIDRAYRFGRRYWVFLAVIALLILAFGVSAPAWAAPVPSAKYQTVPKPTPTSDGDAVATATPRPDDDDEDVGTDNGDIGVGDVEERDVPVFIIDEGASGGDFTATVTSDSLNVREGPGVEYAVVGSLPRGAVVDVLGRTSNSAWLYICCVPETGSLGWASTRLLTVNLDLATSSIEQIPVVGAQGVTAATTASAAAPGEVAAPATANELPIELEISVSPKFLTQGQTATILVTVTNPNDDALLDVEVSDQLPPELALVESTASDSADVEEQESSDGLPVILVGWDRIPSGADVQLVLEVQVADDVVDGTVFDNQASVQASNASYTSGAVTIGMPPVLLPDFQ